MKENAFAGRSEAPTGEELAAALGEARALWDGVIAELGLAGEWHSYSVKAGWSLRMKSGKRTVVYLTPCRGSFRVSFAMGEKAIAAAKAAGLPAKVVKLLDEAPRYAEGAGVRLEIRAKGDLAVVKKLAAAKMAN